MTDLETRRPVWADLYPFGVKPRLTQNFTDMLSAFKAVLDSNPDGAALYFFDEVVSYRQLDNQSNALASWLQDKGVGKNDRVSIITQNLPAFPAMMLAAWKVGAIPVPGNPLYLHKELARILQDAAPSAILCEVSCEAELTLALPLAELEAIPCIVCASDTDGTHSEPTQPNGLSNVLNEYAGTQPKTHSCSPDDLGLILYTSGTTGMPKGAMISQNSLAFTGQFVKEWFDLNPESRMFAIAPFFHITGFVSHLCAAIVAGCGNVINYRFAPQIAFDMIKKWSPTHTVGAITAFNALCAVDGVNPESMKSMKHVYSGGAPNPPALRSELEEILGTPIYPVYGMTETSGPAIFSPFGKEVPILDGQLAIGIPIPSTDIKIVDDHGLEVANTKVGEVLVRGPQVMQAYWGKPEESQAALKDGWLRTGDVGLMDQQGWVYLVDRKKDVIIASGFKIWPREVEDVLYEHPHVREAAVIGIADDYRGENVKACISLRQGESVTEEEIIEHCRSHLTGYKVPRIVEIMNELPKTVTGKIQRVALREAANQNK